MLRILIDNIQKSKIKKITSYFGVINKNIKVVTHNATMNACHT